MPLPLEITITSRAHDAQIVQIDDLLRKPTIYGPASRILGESFEEQITALPDRLRAGECAAALAIATANHKPIGTIVYSEPYAADDPSVVNLEIIATRARYRRRQVASRLLEIVAAEAKLHSAEHLHASIPHEMQDLQWLLSKNNFRFKQTSEDKATGLISLHYTRDLTPRKPSCL